jgi:hypothetical protein
MEPKQPVKKKATRKKKTTKKKKTTTKKKSLPVKSTVVIPASQTTSRTFTAHVREYLGEVITDPRDHIVLELAGCVDELTLCASKQEGHAFRAQTITRKVKALESLHKIITERDQNQLAYAQTMVAQVLLDVRGTLEDVNMKPEAIQTVLYQLIQNIEQRQEGNKGNNSG